MKEQYNKIVVEDYETQLDSFYTKYYVLDSFFKLLGDIKGSNILDIATGTGIIARKLKQRKAKTVVGVDISHKMIQQAKSIEKKENLGINYIVDDATAMKKIGNFDVVTALYYLHYIENKDKLYKASRSIYCNLQSKGRFLTYLLSPNLSTTVNYYKKYGQTVSKNSNISEGEEYTFTLVESNQTFDVHYWKKKTIEEVFGRAGFHKMKWFIPSPSEEGLNKLGEEFWGNLKTTPRCLFFECYKK